MDLSAYLNPLFDGPFEERIERVADLGIDVCEIGCWDVDDLDGVAATARENGVGIAYLSGLVGPTNDPEAIEERIADVADAIETARELDCGMLNVSPGVDLEGYDEVTQFEATLEVLRASAPRAEAAGVTLLLEPLNAEVDHPETFLDSVDEGFKLVAAVDSPAVGVLFDVYHAQIAGGDVIRAIRRHHEHVRHVHVADNPGRHEPGTGEIAFERVFEALEQVGYEGYVGCEFTPTGTPEEALRTTRELLPSSADGNY